MALVFLGLAICKVCSTKFSLIMLCLIFFPFFYFQKVSLFGFLKWIGLLKGKSYTDLVRKMHTNY